MCASAAQGVRSAFLLCAHLLATMLLQRHPSAFLLPPLQSLTPRDVAYGHLGRSIQVKYMLNTKNTYNTIVFLKALKGRFWAEIAYKGQRSAKIGKYCICITWPDLFYTVKYQRWTTPRKMGMFFKFSPRMGPPIRQLQTRHQNVPQHFPEHFCLRLPNWGPHTW